MLRVSGTSRCNMNTSIMTACGFMKAQEAAPPQRGGPQLESVLVWRSDVEMLPILDNFWSGSIPEVFQHLVPDHLVSDQMR